MDKILSADPKENLNLIILNILFLCNKSPWPPKEGGAIAMNRLIEGLIDAGHSVKVLAVNSEKYHVRKEDVPQQYLDKTHIEWVDVDLKVKVLPAFLHFLAGKSYHVSRFISVRFKTKLTQVLKQDHFDIVQLETLFMAPYIPVIRAHSNAKITLRLHNIEHLIWQRLFYQNLFSPKGIYFRHLFRTLKKYELKTLCEVDGLLPITEKDAGFFKEHTKTRIKTIPYGVDLPETGDEGVSENALFYIGAMNWMPNQEGIRWFLKNVWPTLNRKFPQLKFYLAGREMPAWLLNLKAENVVVLGEVEDAEQFVRSKRIAVIPLFSGSGIRIKIIESMSLGKAVVSTQMGAEGIDYENAKNIYIADTSEAFIQYISILYTQPELAEKMGREARKLIAEKHQKKEIIRQLTGLYQEIL
jgi:glycosyltransferase involved in cell wall biosynthesis